jgi:hypothetical protein
MKAKELLRLYQESMSVRAERSREAGLSLEQAEAEKIALKKEWAKTMQENGLVPPAIVKIGNEEFEKFLENFSGSEEEKERLLFFLNQLLEWSKKQAMSPDFLFGIIQFRPLIQLSKDYLD